MHDRPSASAPSIAPTGAPTPPGGTRTAAFYDLDGTLLNGTVVDHYVYYARHDPFLVTRARRLLQTALSAPLYKYLDELDRRSFNEVFYRSYEGLSEDRLAMLGQQLFDTVLSKKLYDGVRELLENDRAVGRVQVLLTGALDFVAQPIAKSLGIAHVVASRLEFGKNGLATGILRPPIMAGPEKATWIREFGRREGIDLENSVAYADDVHDLPMLSMVGRPVAVNPDRRLMATARSHGWPVLKIDAPPRTLLGQMERGASNVAGALAKLMRSEATERAPRARESMGRWGERLRAALDKAEDVLSATGIGPSPDKTSGSSVSARGAPGAALAPTRSPAAGHGHEGRGPGAPRADESKGKS